jgi:hypothetical protein
MTSSRWPDTDMETMLMTQFRKPTRAMALMLASAVILAQYGAAAEARESKSQHAKQRAHGNYTHQTQVQRTASGHARNDTWTNSQGKTSSRNASVVNDQDSGTRTRDVVLQGPQGQQATRHDVTQRTDAGYTRNATATNAQGQMAIRNATVVNNPTAGTRSRDVIATGFNGRTRTVNDDTLRTSDGYVRQTTVTQADGDATTRNVTATYDAENHSWIRDVRVDHDDGG